ncbi:unnamed protein product [Zymoseptoria tritici ST99CH_3D7]|uniref:Uncharacterized protein n=1 Tax=Zymoseptoria tritici (strain ST99CH_3D7) TaxID=1276538 RepID=A0A1X7RVH1_ZYMT9|nr:unnamed protein product [Zymoseptoria tritici ST99CH_3D7]
MTRLFTAAFVAPYAPNDPYGLVEVDDETHTIRPRRFRNAGNAAWMIWRPLKKAESGMIQDEGIDAMEFVEGHLHCLRSHIAVRHVSHQKCHPLRISCL